jgi:hypothetical protein
LYWSCHDKDTGEYLSYSIYLDTVNPPKNQYASIKHDTTLVITKNTLPILKNYYWYVEAKDKYNEVSKSSTFFFRTRNPNAKGMINGYAKFQGCGI